MGDLRREFRLLDEVDVPDLRGRIEDHRSGPHRPQSRHRLLVAAAALVIGLTPVILVARAFLADRSGEESPPVVTRGKQAAPDVLRVVCKEAGTHVLTPVVRAQPDGVHVLVDDRAGVGNVLIRLTDPVHGDAIFSSGSRGVEDEYVDEVAPGPAYVLCRGRGFRESKVDELPWVPFEVVDPGGYFVSYGLDCATSERLRNMPRGGGRGSAEELTRTALDGVLPTDRVEPAGYVEGRYLNMIRVVRSGSVIAAVDILERPSGSTVAGGVVCPASGIA